MKIAIVVPTYNEKMTICSLIEKIKTVARSLDPAIFVVIVDDNSPDGTAAIVEQCRAHDATIHLMQGERRGLGAAYYRGMRYALDEMSADVVVQMDGDLSHDPRCIPLFIDVLQQGADCAIGSRYVAGGSVSRDWPFLRKLNSLIANMLARCLPGLWPIRDCTSGFRAIRAEALKKIPWGKIACVGYVFQVQLLYELVGAGARVREVPIAFTERAQGRSKLCARDMLEFLVWCLRIRFRIQYRRA